MLKYNIFYNVFPLILLFFAWQVFLHPILAISKIIILIFLIIILSNWIAFYENQRITVFLSIFTSVVISFLPYIFNFTKLPLLHFLSYGVCLLTLLILMVTKFSNQVTKL